MLLYVKVVYRTRFLRGDRHRPRVTIARAAPLLPLLQSNGRDDDNYYCSRSIITGRRLGNDHPIIIVIILLFSGEELKRKKIWKKIKQRKRK